MRSSADFEVLVQSIKDTTNDYLGVNTLKRIFGYNAERVVPRISTMDVIAKYIGYSSYHSLIKDLGEDADISLFTSTDCLEVQTLERGVQVRIVYDPNRELILSYLGDFNFVVSKVRGSRNIIEGDRLTITQLAVGHRFVTSHVVRNGEDLGAYESAKLHGLERIEIIP